MKTPPELFLIDGDVIKDENCERQFFKGVVGKAKAEALGTILAPMFPNVPIVPVISYLNTDTLRAHKSRWLNEPVIILSGLDNNDSRCILEDEVNRLKNVVLISGGNEELDGQVHIFARKNRKDLTPTLTQIAPEVRHNRGIAPGTDGHCLEKGMSDPQTAMINRAVGMAMEMVLRYFTTLEPYVKEDKTFTRNTGFHICKPKFNEIRVDGASTSIKGFWRDPVPGLETASKKRRKRGCSTVR